jgi:hypothetical protein
MCFFLTAAFIVIFENRRVSTREIKSRIVMAKAAFNKKKTFYQQTGRNLMEETGEVLHLQHSFVWC